MAVGRSTFASLNPQQEMRTARCDLEPVLKFFSYLKYLPEDRPDPFRPFLMPPCSPGSRRMTEMLEVLLPQASFTSKRNIVRRSYKCLLFHSKHQADCRRELQKWPSRNELACWKQSTDLCSVLHTLLDQSPGLNRARRTNLLLPQGRLDARWGLSSK